LWTTKHIHPIEEKGSAGEWLFKEA